MRIATNMAALVGRQALARSQEAVARAMERLATGKRINRAADDPSGLLIASQLSSRRVELEEVINQAELAGHRLGSAEGGLSVVSDLLVELNGLVVAAGNGSALSEPEKEAMQIEVDGILKGLRHIIGTTTFEGKPILAEGVGFEFNGTYHGTAGISVKELGAVTGVRVDPLTGDETQVRYSLADLTAGGGLRLFGGDLELAQESVKAATSQVSRIRGSIGSLMKYTLGNEANALRIEMENTAAAESRIVDADLAAEASALVRGQILQQAAIKTILIGRQNAMSALSLLG